MVYFSGEFAGTDRSVNTKGSNRLLRITKNDDGTFRVRISGEGFGVNASEVVISDATMSKETVDTVILTNLPKDLHFVVDNRSKFS